jgi:ATP-dependent DNA ligase
LPSVKARFVEPMKAKLVEKPPTTGDWIYELKFDGIRLIAVKTDKKVSLLSRNQNELGRAFSRNYRGDKEFACGRMRDRWRSGCARP